MLLRDAIRRGNQLGVSGWTAVADALEQARSLTSLNGCDLYAAICAGGMKEMKLEQEWELVVWASRFLERSSSTLTTLDIRFAAASSSSSCLCFAPAYCSMGGS